MSSSPILHLLPSFVVDFATFQRLRYFSCAVYWHALPFVHFFLILIQEVRTEATSVDPMPTPPYSSSYVLVRALGSADFHFIPSQFNEPPSLRGRRISIRIVWEGWTPNFPDADTQVDVNPKYALKSPPLHPVRVERVVHPTNGLINVIPDLAAVTWQEDSGSHHVYVQFCKSLLFAGSSL